MKELILATSNPGKISEIQAILSTIKCIPQHDLGVPDAEETGLSFIENAIVKARHASRLTNKPALADDSGLVVHALNGQPGIYSARFAGNHASSLENINLLLQKLKTTPAEQRQAYFYCAIAIVEHEHDPIPFIATGKLVGSITGESIGDAGFGYDPVFYLEAYGCTAAQLPISVKNTISHRALALNKLHHYLLTTTEKHDEPRNRSPIC